MLWPASCTIAPHQGPGIQNRLSTFRETVRKQTPVRVGGLRYASCLTCSLSRNLVASRVFLGVLECPVSVRSGAVSDLVAPRHDFRLERLGCSRRQRDSQQWKHRLFSYHTNQRRRYLSISRGPSGGLPLNG